MRGGRQLEAIAYARRHLAPWAPHHMPELQRAAALLAFQPDTLCAPYKQLLDDERVGGVGGMGGLGAVAACLHCVPFIPADCQRSQLAGSHPMPPPPLPIPPLRRLCRHSFFCSGWS